MCIGIWVGIVCYVFVVALPLTLEQLENKRNAASLIMKNTIKRITILSLIVLICGGCANNVYLPHNFVESEAVRGDPKTVFVTNQAHQDFKIFQLAN